MPASSCPQGQQDPKGDLEGHVARTGERWLSVAAPSAATQIHQRVTTTGLAGRLEVSRRTVLRDAKALSVTIM
ncbi:HTH domain-containing protein [Citricoccus nitrophenolicus]